MAHKDDRTTPADKHRPPAAEADAPIGMSLTLQRLSLAELLKAERAKLDAARRDVRQAIKGFKSPLH